MDLIPKSKFDINFYKKFNANLSEDLPNLTQKQIDDLINLVENFTKKSFTRKTILTSLPQFSQTQIFKRLCGIVRLRQDLDNSLKTINYLQQDIPTKGYMKLITGNDTVSYGLPRNTVLLGTHLSQNRETIESRTRHLIRNNGDLVRLQAELLRRQILRSVAQSQFFALAATSREGIINTATSTSNMGQLIRYGSDSEIFQFNNFRSADTTSLMREAIGSSYVRDRRDENYILYTWPRNQPAFEQQIAHINAQRYLSIVDSIWTRFSQSTDYSQRRRPNLGTLNHLQFLAPEFPHMQTLDLFRSYSNTGINLDETVYSSFDFDKDNFNSILPMLLSNTCELISFSTHYSGRNNAFGDGANKCAFTFINKDLVAQNILIQTRGQFVDLNENHEFWQSELNIKAFCKYLHMMTTSGCLLQYHFEPNLLQKLTDSTISSSEIDSYVELISSETYEKILNTNTADFKLLTGYDSTEEYYKDFILPDVSTIKQQLYTDTATYFIAYFGKLTIAEADNKISGSHELNADMVLNMCTISPSHAELWENFVRSLTNLELRQLLDRFGSSTLIDNKYNIVVCQYLNVDISIKICSSEIKLSEKLFDENNLENLKLYLLGDDKISD
jgi:hypothetical protein